MLSGLENILLKFVRSHYYDLPTSYNWKFSLSNFPEPNFRLIGNNSYEQSKALRLYISSAIQSNFALKEEYQKWYVRYWGGVRGNKNSTLDRYVVLPEVALEQLGVNGVATWSKILSLRNPEKYAIYDARVALSINSLQKMEGIKSPIFFPQLPSRNKSFVVPAQNIIKTSRFFENENLENFYSVYLRILRNVADHGPWDIQDIEMVLFSQASTLSQIWQIRE